MFRKLSVALLVCSLLLGTCALAFAAPRTLAEIKESGVLRVGVENETWGLFHIWEGEKLTGFEIDLCDTIAKDLGVKAEYVPIPWGDGEEGSVTGALKKNVWKEWDMIAAGVTITTDREKVVSFGEWMFNAGQVLVVRKDSGIADLPDVQGKKIGAQQNTSSFTVIDERLKGAEGVPFETVAEGFAALREGKLQGFVIDSPLALQEAKAHSDILEVIEKPLSRERLGLVLPKGCDPELLKTVDQVVLKNRKGLYKKWFR